MWKPSFPGTGSLKTVCYCVRPLADLLKISSHVCMCLLLGSMLSSVSLCFCFCDNNNPFWLLLLCSIKSRNVKSAALLVQWCFGFLIFLWFHMNFRFVFTTFVKNTIEVSLGMTLNLYFSLANVIILLLTFSIFNMNIISFICVFLNFFY